MLIELYGRNYGCFRDEFHLSLLATDIDPDSDRGIVEVKVEGDDQPLRLLRAVALYGPNASGKSTLLRAAGALSDLLATTARLASDSPLESYEPFALGRQSEEPSRLGVVAIVDSNVYDYSISFDRAVFHTERLVQRRSYEGEQVLIDRDRQNVSGSWTDDDQFKLVSKEFRPNALLLPLSDSLVPSLAKTIAVGLRDLLHHSDFSSFWPAPVFGQVESWQAASRRAYEDRAFSDWLLARLMDADLGVVGIRPTEQEHEPLFLGDEPSAKEKTYVVHLRHKGERQKLLPLGRESRGTFRIVELSPMIYDLTHGEKPQAAFVDEFDASMHPLLLRGIVEYFNCHKPTSKSPVGQLIFAAHETSLLDDEAKDAVLRRDQVYLCEKDANGASRLFSVAEFKERNNLNIRRRYLQGRYGALPALGEFTE